ncbi:hypothetical protein P7C73_g2870, partial [Tremellales sp. Uapishka_1]
MPYISTEALVGGALLAVLVLGYQYIPKTTDPTGKSSNAKKKNRKRTKGDKAVEVNDLPAKSTPVFNAKNDKARPKPEPSPAEPRPEASPVPATAQQPASEDDPSPSFAAAAAARPKTLAEKLLPKTRKTKVDDMLAPEDRPAQPSRVMKIVPPSPASSNPAAQPAKLSNFENDYVPSSEDGTSTEDDGWDVVASKKKKVVSISNSSSSSQNQHQQSTAPLSVSTKTQRKNAAKSAANKAAKEAEEADRLRRLAMHRKDLERERINEIYSQKKANPAKGKVLGGGSQATITPNGKLVWD